MITRTERTEWTACDQGSWGMVPLNMEITTPGQLASYACPSGLDIVEKSKKANGKLVLINCHHLSSIDMKELRSIGKDNLEIK